MTRDMVALFKFLTTMESRESELTRRRVGGEDMRYISWNLTFDDEGTSRFSFSVDPAPLRWEVTNFRGMDMVGGHLPTSLLSGVQVQCSHGSCGGCLAQDTADVDIHGFGDRKLRWGEGATVQSPADVSKLLGLPMPTEDDVLHNPKLPNFSDSLR
jgi:hypothetical protein